MMMLLDESDIDAIVKHLGDKVQFYDASGVANNGDARDQIRNALRSYVGTAPSKAAERFRLTEIALDQDLRYRGIHYKREEVAKRVVDLADAVLAAMDPQPERRDTSMLAAVRAVLQERFEEDSRAYNVRPPGTTEAIRYRLGHIRGLVVALDIIDKALAAENPDAN